MKNEKFYSLTYKTIEGQYTKLQYMKSLDRVKKHIEIKEYVYGFKCEIEEVHGTLFLTWIDADGKMVPTWTEEWTLPVIASEERFS
jgi:hypothetical protein